MRKKARPVLVGSFILGACLLVIIAVAVWGSGRLFQKRMKYVCYFPGSVHGLVVGAPVKYRGVPIGEVVGMSIRFEQPADVYKIPVFIELDRRRVRELGRAHVSELQLITDLVNAGLRARLDGESFVTGQLYVNLDLFPDTPATFVNEKKFPEIPTVPTQLEEITKSLTAIVEELHRVDLTAIAKSVEGAVEGINKLVNTPSVKKTLDELPAAVASARKLIIDIDGGVFKIAPELAAVLDPRGPIWGELQRTFQDVQHAAQAVRTFADFLQRNPNALIVGKPRP
ncbi:MAG: MlaD family protein [Polyangia bacterium]